MTPSDTVMQEAIEWLVRAHSGEMASEEQRQFAQWREASIENERACQSVEKILGVVSTLADKPTLRAELITNSDRRNFVRNTIGIGMLVGISSLLFRQSSFQSNGRSALQTAKMERTARKLSDGTEITLNARSAVSINISENLRSVRLLEGLIYLNVEKSATSLAVLTDFGSIRLNQGQITVRTRSDKLSASVIEGHVEVETNSNQRYLINAGQGFELDSHGPRQRKINPTVETAWLTGLIEVNNQPVSELIDWIRDYRSGIIRVEPSIADLKLSGIFSLDDTDATMDSIAKTLNLNITRYTDFFVSIHSKNDA